MVILGVADGPDSGAALLVDDRVVALEEQERHDQVPRSRAFPWQAIEAVLRQGGLGMRDVDLIAVAGRFTPPLIVRRMPSLSGVAGQNPFSTAADLAIYFQAALRQSGVGAMEAERASAWLERRFRERGFQPQRVVLVDLHKALAEAVYRCQPDDQLAVITLHPMGDGVVSAAYRGKAGQLDKVWEQRGFNALHLHLARCARALRLEPLVDDDRLFGLAAAGTPQPELVELLSRQLAAKGPRLECADPLQTGPKAEAVYRALGEARREDAAASVLANLVTTVTALVRHHASALGCRHVGLGGALFENPRLIAAVAELDGVDRVWVHPTPGFASLPTGAAITLGGAAPRPLVGPGLGAEVDATACARALGAAGLTSGAEISLDAALAAGPVCRFVGRSGFGRFGLGTRTVLVRADQAADVAAVRRSLDRPEGEEVLVISTDAPVAHAAALAGPLALGVAAPRVDAAFAQAYPAVVAADGRAPWHVVRATEDPELHGALVALAARTGCRALAAFPLATGREPAVSRPSDAIRVWRALGRGTLQLGPLTVAHRRG